MNAVKQTPQTVDSLKLWLLEKGINSEKFEDLLKQFFEERYDREQVQRQGAKKQDDDFYKKDQCKQHGTHAEVTNCTLKYSEQTYADDGHE